MRTVAELRKIAVGELAKRHADYTSNTYEVIKEATKAMNAFYRYAGFAVNKFYYENDGRRYDERTAAKLEEEDNRKFAKVREYFKAFNADIRFNGIYPSIVEREAVKAGCYRTLNLVYWYN